MSNDTQLNPLYTDPDLAQFYDLENNWEEDFSLCSALAEGAGSVLDLGCGTGELAAALSKGRRVVGVDPAAAMLDIARRRAGGERVEWVRADARTLALNERFDLIVLTGHSFQVFLSDQDQSAVLQTICRHLSNKGQFVFDTRNPAVEAWKRWTPESSERTITHPDLGPVNVWNDASFDNDTQVVTYETHYKLEGQSSVYSAAAKIRFTPKPALEKRLLAAGLTPTSWLGGWQGTPFHDAAKEIIPIGKLSR